jgi:hypothetical protein
VIIRRLLKAHPLQHEASVFVVTPAVKQKKNRKAKKSKKQKPKGLGYAREICWYNRVDRKRDKEKAVD